MNTIDHIIVNVFHIEPQSPEMTYMHSMLAWAFFAVIAIFFYMKRNQVTKLRKDTALFIEQRGRDLHQLVQQSDAFVQSSPTDSARWELDSDLEGSRKMRMLLTKYESLASDVNIGLVSERHVIEAYGDAIVKFIDFAKKSIHLYRIKNNRELAFTNIEGLYIRIKYGKNSIFQYAVEWITNKKFYAASIQIFKIKYFLISRVFGLNMNYLKEENYEFPAAVKFFDETFHLYVYFVLIAHMIYYNH